ncbi:NUDIX domain-containing protein [Pseudomonas sp.]|uniref:NUDIX hydrolase n=1 Tax=Pseudomonas sp. TaxID=306 RepID=UPI0026107003|nr:NUDIX domain-containing protein [Pseudomonas sp.]
MGASKLSTANAKTIKRRATVIFRRDDRILFVRKRKAKWNLPGGRVEQNETPLQAALREMAEETGMTLGQLFYISEYEESNVIHYLFETAQSVPQEPQPCNEIADCRWFTVSELGKRNVSGAVKALLKHWASEMAVRLPVQQGSDAARAS